MVGDHAAAERARAIGARTKELTELLVERELPSMKLPEELPRRLPPLVPPACVSSTGTTIRCSCSTTSRGARGVEWTASERCCGFGGLFSMKLPEVSVAMADDKLVSLAEQHPDVVVSADSSCLMHLRSRCSRRQPDPDPPHRGSAGIGLEGKAP